MLPTLELEAVMVGLALGELACATPFVGFGLVQLHFLLTLGVFRVNGGVWMH